tara:strand:+ start:1097 stop:1297 length:201 start_codon:yes stop_codon:yes gene_type:complete
MTEKNCVNCNHFYITYTPNFPYGCKAFGIRSKNIPYLEVRRISGTDCALFSKRIKNVKMIKRGRLA